MPGDAAPHDQVRLSLARSDYFTVATAGTSVETFLNYINVRTNEVRTYAALLRQPVCSSSGFSHARVPVHAHRDGAGM